MADTRTVTDRAVSFDPVADRYDATRGGLARGGVYAESLVPWLAPGRALEVGVGTGVVATALRGRGVNVVGVDLSPLMAAHAVTRIGPRVALGDAHALPIADTSVDTVLFVWVLHLVGGLAPALAEAARVLRPGGRVAIVHDVPQRTPTDLDGPLVVIRPARAARPDTVAAVSAAATGAGLVPVHLGETARHPLRKSPAEAIAEIETRTWSYLWHIDEPAWGTTIVPMIEELRGLPDPDRPREYQAWHRLAVFARP